MSGPSQTSKILAYLQGLDIPLRDPLWKHVYLNSAFQKLIHSPPFLRLREIRQLSSATLVYPGARHTRYEHSIGVFWMARRLVLALLSKAESQAHFPGSLEGVKAYLAAALLHDLGHFPYAHVLEGLDTEHEELSALHILSPPLAHIIENNLGTSAQLVAALVDEERSIPAGFELEAQLYRSLLSGTLDPDKLDYLNRDAYFCGVPYGIQDLEYLFSQVHLGPAGLCVPERSLTIIESLIFSRYLMYRSVYWHRNVRALSAPVVEASAAALEQGLLSQEAIFASNDTSFPKLFSGLSLPQKQLCLEAQDPRSFVVVDEICLGYYRQMDDKQLFSKLKNRRQRLQITRELHRDLEKHYQLKLEEWQVMLDITGPRKMSIQDIHVSKPLGADPLSEPIIPFMQSSTVLQEKTLEHFCSSLTMLRLVLPLSVAEQLDKQAQPLRRFLSHNFISGLGELPLVHNN